MNLKRKILKRGGFLVSVFMSMGMLVQQASAKTPTDTLVMAWNLDAISTFDPAQFTDVYGSEIIYNVCDNLVSTATDDPTKIVPSLATHWDVSGDDHSTVITFHLRDGLKFNDGRAANANDLVWGMKRIVKLKMGNAAIFNEYGITEKNIDDALQAPDEKTVVMKFDKPYPAELILNNVVASRATALLDRETIMKHEKDGDLGNRYLKTHAACVGPYELKSWRPGEALLLRASSHYWGDAPKLKQILIRHVAEPGTQRLLLQKHDIDVARNLTPEDLADLQKAKDIKVEKVLVPTMMYWGFNTTNPIFAKEKVRLAMRYLIDYEGLGKKLLKGIGIPRASFIPLGNFGALDEKEGQPFKLDIQKAKKLLAEAGYPNGFEANFLVSNAPYTVLFAQSLQDSAAQAGVHLKIERVAGTQLFSKVNARAFDTAFIGWNNDSADPHTMASRLVYNPDNRFEAKNTAYPSWKHGYFDAEMNQKVEEALFQKDPQKRAKIYADLQRELMQKGPYAFIYQQYSVIAMTSDVKKWVWNSAPRIFYSAIEK
ncbi:ABC transporter substrate-binding protein [Bartonella krasnovii]|uniref:ABC transporter substrate-binding protein n=1 Tax=Bartonella krasnovii TaxID=2267275 RepID=A0A5B9D2I9_9HYPH|nr:ABC transporter substrate-binding protein [Bartonella krasnovii]QEE12610.1 ABC transporter substrate-binding protein [Bartonella krasnovii]UNF38399.1 ABC transporter substrate-binding protein [Bartonella krasnovii]UNF41788.1 ABC transporter substrate-binding protein [Bartonella krasnovii]UNF43445.1 ABC transporter substrate-binding protein [Bartonella krasnovii]UNF45035.1 ABC transporter substrate-binding protein [Bartonella krasnovii]